MMLTGAQIRAARGLLNLSVAELCELTGLAINTVRRAEASNGPAKVTAGNLKLIQSTLEGRGVIFIAADDLGPGVRLLDPTPAPQTPRRRMQSSAPTTG